MLLVLPGLGRYALSTWLSTSAVSAASPLPLCTAFLYVGAYALLPSEQESLRSGMKVGLLHSLYNVHAASTAAPAVQPLRAAI